MSATPVSPYSASTTASGSIASGILTFTSSAVAANFIVGALAWLTDSSGANNVCVQILAVSGANVTVAFQPFSGQAGLPPQNGAATIPGMGAGISFTGNYGASNLNSPVTYGTGSTLSQWLQLSNLDPLNT